MWQMMDNEMGGSCSINGLPMRFKKVHIIDGEIRTEETTLGTWA